MSKVAIVDYGLGNLFSIQNACLRFGLTPMICRSASEIESAEALILPGVGAFGQAMTSLRNLDLIGPIKDFAQSGKPLLGICLGIQLLMSESLEFGSHQGLDLIPGQVVPLASLGEQTKRIPQVGWNQLEIKKPHGLLEGLSGRDYFYFVHSYVAVPVYSDCIASTTCYVDATFCSSIEQANLFACQFHPERSGEAGLRVYQNLAQKIKRSDVGHESD